MDCGNISLFGKEFVLRFVGSETSVQNSSVNAVMIRLSSSGFGELTFIAEGVAATTMFSWEARK